MDESTKHKSLLKAAIDNVCPYPSANYRGTGVVICAGGPQYLACAFVCLSRLRDLGCNLPVQIWHLGESELPPHWKSAFGKLAVEFVDAFEVRECNPSRILNGWELKPYSIIYSPFQNVLLLDADNVPLRDPCSLFGSESFTDTGAMFWPDRGRLKPENPLWLMVNVPYRDEPEFESGQLLIDKQKCWRPLQLTMHLNEYSDYYYRFLHGDKETFHLGWRIAGAPYWMAPPLEDMEWQSIYQHDGSGERIFQHRSGAKWKLYEGNDKVRDFRDEEQCLAALETLKGKLADDAASTTRSSGGRYVARAVIERRYFWYKVKSHPPRRLELLASHNVGVGAMAMQRRWDIVDRQGDAILRLHGDAGLTAELHENMDGAFSGRCVTADLAEVALIPVAPYELSAGTR